jgi:hypothetical protein
MKKYSPPQESVTDKFSVQNPTFQMKQCQLQVQNVLFVIPLILRK